MFLLSFILCFFSSLYVQQATVDVQAAVPHIKRETLPLLLHFLYGGLMIYCSNCLFLSSYFEGRQSNLHAHFLCRPSETPHWHRNVHWCHCMLHSCDPVQRLFHHNSLSVEKESQTQRAQFTLHAAPTLEICFLQYCPTIFTTGLHSDTRACAG